MSYKFEALIKRIQIIRILQIKMIISLEDKKPKKIPKKFNWKDILRAQLYKRNKLIIKQQTQKKQNKLKKLARESAGAKIIKCLQETEYVKVNDPVVLDTCHAYYSSYVPLQIQTKFDSQLDYTFPYLKYLQQTGKSNDRQLIYLQISEFLKKRKAENCLMYGWKQCLKKFLIEMDSIRSIELYLQLKKKGTIAIQELYKQYGNNCQKNVFFHRVTSASKYFAHQQKPMLMPLSLQAHDQINEVTMPKTMKMLFCSICLTYDCGQHSLDDLTKIKDYKYVSPKNIISQEQKLEQAIGLCAVFKQFKTYQKTNLPNQCKNQCYKSLDLKIWEEIQTKKRASLLSPIVKGLIKLSIEMFGYKPCQIWKMLVGCSLQKDKTSITCAMVFKFLIDDYNLFSKLEKKLYSNENQLLKRQIKGQDLKHQIIKKKQKKIKVMHHNTGQFLSTCCHYFVGEEPTDHTCQDCSCRERGFCMPQCLCSPNCTLKSIGCKCKKEGCSKKCPCTISKKQCDPLLCQACFKQNSKCQNKNITLGRAKKTKIGRSTIPGAGLGLFADDDIVKDEFVEVYTGELIEPSIDLLREVLSVDLTFYNFGSPQGTVDARFMGNLSRFINHGNVNENQNLRSENVLSNGRYKIAFYALRNIEKGEELFFNYDGEGQLYKNYHQKYPFIKPFKKINKS